MHPLVILIINTLLFLMMLFMNSVGGSGYLTTYNVGEVSRMYPTLITPAGYAFSIWGLIYLQLTCFIGFLWYQYLRKKEYSYILNSFPWFGISCIANSLWIVFWSSNQIGLSLLFILFLLTSLVMLAIRYRLEVWDAPLRIIFFIWWPFAIYLGWVILATTINVTIFLIAIGWNPSLQIENFMAVLVLTIATAIYLTLILKRNLRESALAGIWGITAIVVHQYGENTLIFSTSLISSGILLITISIHAYLKRRTLPHQKVTEEV